MYGISSGKTPPLMIQLHIFAYVLINIKYVFDSSALIKAPPFVDTVISGLFMLCMILKLLSQRYTLFQLIMVGIAGLSCLYSSIAAQYSSMLISFLCIASVQDVDLYQVLKASYITKSVLLAVHVLSYAVIYNLNPSSVQFVYRTGSALRRHYFFLGHANTFMAILLWTSLEIIYVHYKSLKGIHFAGIYVVNFIFYCFTNSNTGFVLLTVTMILIYFNKRKTPVMDKLVYGVSRFGFAFCSLFFPLLIVVQPYLSGAAAELWDVLNQFQSGRLLYGAYAYDIYGFTLLGRAIDFPNKVLWNGHWIDNVLFDNAYLWLFLIYGAIHLLLFSIFLFVLTPKMSDEERIIVVIYIFYGIMESYIMNIVYCFPLLFFGKYLFEKKLVNRHEEGAKIPLWKRRSV